VDDVERAVDLVLAERRGLGLRGADLLLRKPFPTPPPFEYPIVNGAFGAALAVEPLLQAPTIAATASKAIALRPTK
jgi:hypothetical protein